MTPAERQEYYREEIREMLRERGEKPTKAKVERVLHDLEALAEIFVESVTTVK